MNAERHLHAPNQGLRCSKLSPQPIDLAAVAQVGCSRQFADAIPQDHITNPDAVTISECLVGFLGYTSVRSSIRPS